MKTISARQFRLAFPTLLEEVQVTLRRATGEYVTLGTWVPSGMVAPGVVIVQQERATFHPVPKPGKR